MLPMRSLQTVRREVLDATQHLALAVEWRAAVSAFVHPGTRSALGSSAPVSARYRGPAVSGILFYLAIAFAVSCSFGWRTRAARRERIEAEACTNTRAPAELTWFQ
jgi:hypothetical protein